MKLLHLFTPFLAAAGMVYGAAIDISKRASFDPSDPKALFDRQSMQCEQIRCTRAGGCPFTCGPCFEQQPPNPNFCLPVD